MTFKKKLSPLFFLFVLCATFLLVQGCTSSKKVLYLQDVEAFEQQEIDYSYEPVIHKDDLLEIIVNSRDPELALPFNMPMAIYQGGTISTAQDVLGFLVDSDGNIDFPILGTIYVSGLTRSQLVDSIRERLIEENLIKDPIVTVQFQNFKISVIGEVSRPGTFNVASDRITLMDAISMAGDLTIQGKRDRVAVIREKDGKRTIMYHDLRSADVFRSPFYYLKQNDVIYVEPNKARIGQSRINQNNSVGVWLSAMSVLASIVSIIISANK